MDTREYSCVLCSGTHASAQHSSASLLNICKLILTTNCKIANQRSEIYGCDEEVRENEALLQDVTALEEGNVFVCPACSKLTEGALDSRSRVERLEVEVRLLQSQLLQLLRRLQKEVEVYCHQMGKIESVITKVSPTKAEPAKERSVRERVLEVVTDLRLFQSDLNDRLMVGRTEEKAETFRLHSAEAEQLAENLSVGRGEEEVELLTCTASPVEEEEPPDVEEGLEEASAPDYTGYLAHYILGAGGVGDALAGGTILFACSSPSASARLPPTKRRRSGAHSNKLRGVNLSGMSAFKKGLIKRAMEREMKRKSGDDFHENPLIKYYLRYDPSTDSFFVGNVQIRLNAAGVLECTGGDCDTKWTPSPTNEHTTTFDRDIRNHVIGKHTSNGFTCRVCNLILNSYFKLMTHFKKLHPGQKPLKDKHDPQNFLYVPSVPNHRQNVQSPGAHFSRGSPCKSLERFHRKRPRRLKAGLHLQTPSSPSEDLKQVRMSMKSAIESLGDMNGFHHSSQTAASASVPRLKRQQRSSNHASCTY